MLPGRHTFLCLALLPVKRSGDFERLDVKTEINQLLRLSQGGQDTHLSPVHMSHITIQCQYCVEWTAAELIRTPQMLEVKHCSSRTWKVD